MQPHADAEAAPRAAAPALAPDSAPAVQLLHRPGALPGWARDAAAAWHAGQGAALLVGDAPDPRARAWLAIDDAALAAAQAARGRGASSTLWALTDAGGRMLDGRRPLLEPITAGQGLHLRLMEQLRAGSMADRVAAVAVWRTRRQLRLAACWRYAHGSQSLATALVALVRQALHDLALGVPPPPALADDPATVQPSPAGPGRWQAAGWRLRGRWHHEVELLRSRWLSEYWRIGVVDAPVLEWIRSGGQAAPVRWITPRRRQGYWADPMGMVGNDRQLFCEYFCERSGQGHLELLQLDDAGQVGSRTRLPVGGGSHVSFPLVVELDGRRLGVAEAAATRDCLLYEVDATGHWQPVARLLHDVPAADPALFAWEGRYWLAITDMSLGSADNLCLYHADRLEGPWQPHANNPVKRDAAGSRMAGGFFEAEGALHRPAQDCLNGYGRAVVLYRVLRCTPTEYVEEPVARLAPDPHGPCPDGLHTLSVWGQRTLIDGKRLALNPLALQRKLLDKLRRRPAHAPPPAPADGPRGRGLVVYVPHLRLGGGETSLLRLAAGLARLGWPVTLVTHSLATQELPVPDGVQLVSLDTHGTAAAVRRLAALLRQRRPAAMVSGFPHTNVAAVVAAKLAGGDCRCVLTEHAPLSHQIRSQGGWRYRLLPPLVRWCYQRAAAVVAVSNGVRDDLQRLVGAALPLHVIANPVLPEVSEAELAAQPMHRWLADPSLQVVLTVSRLSVEKDIPTLIDAFARLRPGRPGLRLLIAGDGPERGALAARLADAGLADVAEVAGRVAQPMAWMRRAAVFALASRFEGFGNVLVEALASGCPVVSTDCPVGPREILDGGRHGALVPVGDAAAMAAALAAAIDGGAAPPAARAHGQRFTVARACASYSALIDSLLCEGRDGSRPC